MSDSPVEAWWADLTTAALVGTARRAVPDTPAGLPAREASPEERLLDAAALGSALRRAGREPATGPVPVGAADDVLPVAPRRARQLLDLVLTQSPVGARLQPQLLKVWLDEATRHGVRAPHTALVPLLQAASGDTTLQDAVRPVLDERGRWIAAAHPAYAWVGGAGADDEPTDVDAWVHLPTERRAVVLAALRRTDPGAARALLESTWGSDPAPVRRQLVGVLRTGLGPDDEEFLDRARTDRAAGVREQVWALLDRLPDSRRAHRMGRLLAPLLSGSGGLLRKRVQVELPTAPSPEAQQDGLVAAPKGRSERGFWLERIVAAAPLEVWTEATGLKADVVARTLDDADALAGLRRTVQVRRDVGWARELLARGEAPDEVLISLLPAEEAARHARARLQAATRLQQVMSLVGRVPPPWSPELSTLVVARLRAVEREVYGTAGLVAPLAAGLHPSVAGHVQSLANATRTAAGMPDTALHQLAQYLSLVPTVTEAFT